MGKTPTETRFPEFSTRQLAIVAAVFAALLGALVQFGPQWQLDPLLRQFKVAVFVAFVAVVVVLVGAARFLSGVTLKLSITLAFLLAAVVVGFQGVRTLLLKVDLSREIAVTGLPAKLSGWFYIVLSVGILVSAVVLPWLAADDT